MPIKGIEKYKIGNRIGDVSYTIQQYAEAHGYSVVRELVGHGLGKKMHESPEVPNYGKLELSCLVSRSTEGFNIDYNRSDIKSITSIDL